MTDKPKPYDSTALWIVEDSDDYREQLRDLLDLDQSIDCRRAFASYEEARACLQSEQPPEVILMDLNLPGIHGIQGVRELKQMYPTLLIIVLTVSGNRKSVFEALKAGAAGYLLKSESYDGIVQHIHDVIDGGAPISSSVTPFILDVLKTTSVVPVDSDLSQREIGILNFLANGLSRKEIAQELSVATVTVDYHLRSIYSKLKVHSTSGAVGIAFRKGILK